MLVTDGMAVLEVEVALVEFDEIEVIGERLEDEHQQYIQARRTFFAKI